MSLIQQLEQQLNEQDELFAQQWTSPRDVHRWLLKNGYRKLGSGAIASAYARAGDNKIVRVSHKPDSCWPRFIEWIKSRRPSRYLPKVYQTAKYNNGKFDFWVAVVERLRELTPTSIMTTPDLEALAELYTMGMMTHEVHRAIQRRFAREGIHKDDIERWLDDNHHNEFTYLTNAVDQFADETDCMFDLHHGNLMFRPSTKGLVLIDPLGGVDHV